MLYIAFKHYAVQSIGSTTHRHAIWSHFKFMTVNLNYVLWLSHEQNVYHQTTILVIVFTWGKIEKGHCFTSKIITTLTNPWECLFTCTNQSNNFDIIILAFISLIDLNTIRYIDNLLPSISLIYVAGKSIFYFSYALAITLISRC